MKGIPSLVAALLVLLPCVAQADLVFDGFPTNPGMVVTSGDTVTGRLSAPGIGASWTMQTSVNINHWWHYAPLQLGVDGTGSDADHIPNGWNQISVRFSRGDDSNRRASLWTYNATAGWGWNPLQADPTSVSGPLAEGAYNVLLMGKPGGYFRAVVSTATNVAWDSGWRFLGNIDDISGAFVQVPNLDNQGFVEYDASNERINFYGYQGSEGEWYKYDIGGYINGLGLVTGINYSVLPETAYEPTSAQTAELVEDNFSADPNLTVVESGDYLDLLCASRPVPGTLGGAFLFESEIGITLFNHYGSLKQGVEGTGRWTRAYINFQKADDGVESCCLALLRDDWYEVQGVIFGGNAESRGRAISLQGINHL